MATIVFYGNPRSPENLEQRDWLSTRGHNVDARDLTQEPWSVSSLRPYFGAKPVREWFNPNAPRVKLGEINFDKITPQQALIMLILEPDLINAPLMRIGSHCEAGFDVRELAHWIEISPLGSMAH
ncbi:MAG: hypothetical protein EB015_21710 [Methylocystaceae bacterium]|nr:hypothetical protein [Methylocystaceae bacterium]